MLEALERRQFLSATPTADATFVTEPAPADSQVDYVEQGTLTARKTGEGQQDYLVVKIKQVYIPGV